MRRGAGGCRRVVGHSYGGAIISDAATGVANVVGLVFASAFAPDEGETLGELNARFAPPARRGAFPGRLAGLCVARPGGVSGQLRPGRCPAGGAGHGRGARADRAAFAEPAGPPAWRRLPSWSCSPPGVRMIYPDLLRFMADRVGARTVEVRSSNASAVSHPHQVARLVLAAARVGTRGWAGVAAELASGRGHGPQPGGIDPPDRRRGQPAQESSGPEVAGRKGRAGRAGRGRGRAPAVEGVDGHTLPDGVQHRLPCHAGIP
jgi:hypothetical protein